MNDPRHLPHQAKAELALLGGVLLRGGDVLDELVRVLDHEDFYAPRARAVWASMVQLHEAGSAVDVFTLEARLRARGQLELVGGIDGLTSLDKHADALNLSSYAGLVRSSAVRRRAVIFHREQAERLQQLDDDAIGDSIAAGQTQLAALASQAAGLAGKLTVPIGVSVEQVAAGMLAHIEGRALSMRLNAVKLDRLLPLRPGKLLVIAGRPAMGKTTWAGSVTRDLTLERIPGVSPPRWRRRHDAVPVLWASGEMDHSDLTARLLADVGTLDSRAVQAPTREWAAARERQIREAMDLLAALPVEFVDDDLSGELTAIEAACWSARARLGPVQPFVVIIDYLQRLSDSRLSRVHSREEYVGKMAMRCKTIARQCGCALILLAQLNREVEKRPDKRPLISDLRESGAIEQEADFVGGLYREHYYDPNAQQQTDRLAELEHMVRRGQALTDDMRTEREKLEAYVRRAEFIGLKSRNGPLGMVPLRFYGRFNRYYEENT